MQQSLYRIVGTAGHIDHGKSALVREITGTDPDRLLEEKERGITIDLGFAHSDFAEDLRVGFIDVPGHERFVKNMLAGIGGIDAVLLVVAADESIMPQTREHLAICQLLGVSEGLVAISKCDLVDAEIVDLVEMEVRDYLADSFLNGAPLVHTSVVTGEGIEALQEGLIEVLRKVPQRPTQGLFRLPIDRVFTVHGFGTVVTGTLLSGSVGVGDTLDLLPSGGCVTVRGLQVHGEPVEQAQAGQRTALNLQGIEVSDLRRGDLLVAPGSMASSHLIDARLQVLDGFGPIKPRQRVRFHHGSAEVLARVAMLDGEQIDPGGSAMVQLRLETPYAVAPGDHFIVRSYSPMITIGGGVVIDGLPSKHRHPGPSLLDRLRLLDEGDARHRLGTLVSDAGAEGAVEQQLCQRLVMPAHRLRELAAEEVEDGLLVQVSDRPLHLLAAGPFDALRSAILQTLADYHQHNALRPGMPKREVRSAVARVIPVPVFEAAVQSLRQEGTIRVEADSLCLDQHHVQLTPAQVRVCERILQVYEKARWSPPATDTAVESLGNLSAEANSVVHYLLRQGELVRLRDDLVFHHRALETLIEELRERYAPGDRFTVAEFKKWTGISRKHAIPLLEYLDQRHMTRRIGDHRERI
ncbi:MAG: selenocysteine-specific translation elongation factor [Acidobacteriota bacterium]